MKLDGQIKLLYHLLIHLQVKITKRAVEEEFEKHPFPFSLLAISDVLSNFYINNVAYQIEINELCALHFPIIAHTSNDKFICIIEVNDNQLSYLTDQGTIGQMTLVELADTFTGAVLTVNTSVKNAFNSKLNPVFSNTLKTIIICAILSMMIFGVLGLRYSSIPNWLLLVFSEILAGLFISTLLITESIDKNNNFIRRICGVSNKSSCNSILSSEQANLTPFLSLAECCLYYFSGSTLFLLSGNHEESMLLLLFKLSLLSLPFTAYSIFYQYKLKGWCLLCCAIVIILWSETITLWHLVNYDSDWINLRSVLLFGLSFTLPVIVWVLLKPLIIARLKLKNVKTQLNAFKYNKDIFKFILSTEIKYKLLTENQAIIIGSRESLNVITIVSNPFCKPCALAHSLLNNWLDIGIDFKLQLVFALPGSNITAYEVSTMIYSIYLDGDEARTKAAIRDWFEWGIKDVHKWKEFHPVNVNPEAKVCIEEQYHWINYSNIQYTPVIFLDGMKLPEMYKLEDIQYMLA
jgi:uncharacterized membrane protein